MPRDHATDDSSPTAIEPIFDHESLRARDDVPFHEERDVVDTAVVEQLADAPDLAGVGITDSDGNLLFRRLTDTCSWKIPVTAVAPDADFVAAITEHVRATIGITVELDAIEGVWDVRLRSADGDRTATRAFVIFDGSLVTDGDGLAVATPEGDAVEEAGWFAELPDEADEIPGTHLFLE